MWVKSIMAGPLARRFRREEGVTAIEYALIGALVSVAAIIAFQAVGSSLSNMFQFIADKLAQVFS
jgi:pilus assembly protein Flp/PilA